MTKPTIDAITLGDGEQNILALHASGTSAGSLVRLAKQLANDATIMIPNLHGYGDSRTEAFGTDHPLQQHLDIARAALATFDGAPVHVVGHSMGAAVALMLASTGASNIVSMTLAEPVCFSVLDPEADAGLIEEDRQSVSGLLAGDEDGVQRFIEYWNGTPWEAIPEQGRLVLESMADQITREALAISADRTPVSAFANIDCPVQILCGSRTNPVALRVCERFAEHCPAWPQVEIVDAGHMLAIEQPAAVAAAVRAQMNSYLSASLNEGSNLVA